MSKKLNNAFTPSSAFIAKKERQDAQVMKILSDIFWKELHVLKKDDFNDIDVLIEEESIHLRHQCVVKYLAPTFFDVLKSYGNFNFAQMSSALADEKCVKSSNFSDLPSEEIEAMKSIYGDSKSLDFTVDLTPLLKTGLYSDVTIKVEDSVFKCHKCILSARCEFFSLMFRGSWIENNIDVIPLHNISVHSFGIILNVIYNGGFELPMKIDINELMVFSDMYNISCLRIVLQHHLKTHYCHFFHLPCQFCILGISDMLLISEGHLGFEILTEDTYKWLIKYYMKIFPTKQFAKFDSNVQNMLKEKIKESSSTSNIIQHLQDCLQVEGRIPHVKSMEAIKKLVKELIDFFIDYFFNHLNLIKNEVSFKFMITDNKNVTKCLLLQERLVEVLPKVLTAANCCRIYESSLLVLQQIQYQCERFNKEDLTEGFENGRVFGENLKSCCQKYIRKNIVAVRRTSQWKELSKPTKNDIMKDSNFLDFSA